MLRRGVTSAILCAFVLWGGSAIAHDYKDSAVVSIHYDEDGRFWGRVKDTTSFCMKNRKVTLRQFRIQKIEQIWISTPFYEFFHEAVPGTDNYVVANRKEQHFRGHDHVCKMSFSDHLYF